MIELSKPLLRITIIVILFVISFSISPQVPQPLNVKSPKGPRCATSPSRMKSPKSSVITPEQQREAEELITRTLRLMHINEPIKGHKLTMVLDALDIASDLYLPVADEVWKYLNKSGTKPNQVAYSKMMKLYSRRGFVQLDKAALLVDQWKHEFKSNPESLRAHLSILSVSSPVIINQMMRAIAIWSGNTFWNGNQCSDTPSNVNVLGHGSVHSALLHYFRVLVELDIVPDKNTLEILWSWTTTNQQFLTPTLCVQLIEEAKSLQVIDCILNRILFQLIHKRTFPQFDEDHNSIITSKIWNLNGTESTDLEHRLYVFRLLYLGAVGGLE